MSRGRRPRTEFKYAERSGQLRRVLKEQRVNILKISRSELTARSGVSESTIQAIEDGRVLDPGVFTVVALGVALRIDLGPMMGSLTGPIRRRDSPSADQKSEKK